MNIPNILGSIIITSNHQPTEVLNTAQISFGFPGEAYWKRSGRGASTIALVMGNRKYRVKKWLKHVQNGS